MKKIFFGILVLSSVTAFARESYVSPVKSDTIEIIKESLETAGIAEMCIHGDITGGSDSSYIGNAISKEANKAFISLSRAGVKFKIIKSGITSVTKDINYAPDIFSCYTLERL